MHAQVNYKPAFGRMSSICSLGHVFSALLIVKMVPRQTQRLMAFVFPEVAFACVFSRGRWLYKGNRNLPYVMVAFSLYTFDLCKRHNPASRRVSSFTSGPFSICRGAFKSFGGIDTGSGPRSNLFAVDLLQLRIPFGRMLTCTSGFKGRAVYQSTADLKLLYGVRSSVVALWRICLCPSGIFGNQWHMHVVNGVALA